VMVDIDPDDTADVELPTAETGDTGDVVVDIDPDDTADVELPTAETGDVAPDDEEFVDEPSNPFEIPPIVMATEVDEETDASGEVDATTARHDDDTGGTPLAPPAVSRDILEELRRADVDGPIVEFAPQDDTTSARRRPKQPVDYDPAPVPIPLQVPRILGRKPRVRKVTRVVRHVDPWSVFKIAIIANIVLYLIMLTAGVLLWNVAYATGTVDNVERFFESFGWQSFEFNGGEIYHSAWIAGLFVALGLTGLAVLGATLFNLITDLVGGVRLTVLEEEVVETRTSPMRRFVVRRPEPEIPAVIQDPSGSIIREAVVDDTGGLPR
ncbi:MAG: DUF3566 domain-containing protein, partial [Ilumatobacter sp.]|nr:DUF3566 domain-containing protein [Ilumatobacter sp.]